MHCRICGDENARPRGRNRGFLCDSCAEDTPAKVCFETFKAKYFSDDPNVPRAIARDFYDDYRSSTHNLEEYIEKTTSYA